MKILLILLNISAFSAVWNHTNVWDSNFEEEYSNWMRTSNVHERIFIDKNSPYYGIHADCADAAYALRAIFAYENSLPFAVKSPSGARDKYPTLNNKLNKWDSAGNETQRLVAMINYIGMSVGSENLTYFDTYPIALSSVNAGSLFTYKIKARFGNAIRHVYTIKDVNPVGTFDTIYSTQAIKAANDPMTRRKSKEFSNLPVKPWGFKRFFWPSNLGASVSKLPAQMNASSEQYEIAETLGRDKFFKYVKNLVKTFDEDAQAKLTRSIGAVCEEAKARVKYVDQAIEHLNNSNGACMDYTDFDTYSTPARDKALTESFISLKDTYKEIEEDDELSRVNPTLAGVVESIFYNVNSSEADLNNVCSIEFDTNKSLNLKELWSRLNSGKISSHPNDILDVRWGEKTTPLTRCKRWY